MKTISGLIVMVALLFLIPAELQAQQSKFTKVFYDNYGYTQSYALAKSFDHNYIIVGYIDNSPLVVKMDPAGNILWSKEVGNNSGGFYCLTPTRDSCFVLAGSFSNPASSDNDILVVKMNSNGDTLWSRSINMGHNDICVSVRQTNDNGFILAGYSSKSNQPFHLALAVKLDAAGNLVWDRIFVGGNYYNYAYSVAQLPDSSFILTGYLENFPPFDAGMFLMRLSPSGSVIWSERQPFLSSDYSAGNDVKADQEGILCYYSTSNAGLMLMKTDYQGNILWNINYPVFSGGYLQDAPPKLYKTSDGGYVVVNGSPFGGGMIIKTDSAGNSLWAQDLFLSAIDVVESDDGGFIVTGNGPLIGVSPGGTTNPQIGIIKTDSLGNSTFCVNSFPITSSAYGINMDSVSFVSESAGLIYILHPAITNITLSADSGCVAFIGAIKENNPVVNTLTVFPNPTGGAVQIRIEGTGTGVMESLEIFNSMGAKVFGSCDPEILQSSVNISAQPAGIYYILVKFGNKILSQKIVVNH